MLMIDVNAWCVSRTRNEARRRQRIYKRCGELQMEEGEESGCFCPKGHGWIVDIQFGLLISSEPPSNPPEP